MSKTRWLAVLVWGLSLGAGTTGCTPFLIGAAPIPVPVQPWTAEVLEAKTAKRLQHRTPIMPPIIPGQPLPTCDDPPSEEEILRALPRVTRGIPYIFEEFRDDYTFVVEKLVDKIDPPTFIPLVGPCQVHHCHYKCTVFFKQKKQSSYPFPYYSVEDRVETVYIDKDHLHRYVGNDPEAIKAAARDLMGP